MPCARFFIVGILGAAAFAAAGCDEPPGHPPIARIVLAPEAIPAHDNFQTAVTLDGSKSADPVDDPGATHPLTYQWEIVDAEHRFESGHDISVKPVVRFLGDRPATIILTVTDEDGLSASATKNVQLTVR